MSSDNQKTRKADISAATYALSSSTISTSSPSQTRCRRVMPPPISDCFDFAPVNNCRGVIYIADAAIATQEEKGLNS